MRFTFQIEIARPPEEVFAYLADPSHLPEWQESAVEVRVEDDRFHEVRKAFGRRLESVLEVEERDAPRRFVVRTIEGPLPIRAEHDLEPAADGTRLSVAVEGEPGGMLGPATRLLVRGAERQFKGDFARLKRILESR